MSSRLFIVIPCYNEEEGPDNPRILVRTKRVVSKKAKDIDMREYLDTMEVDYINPDLELTPEEQDDFSNNMFNCVGKLLHRFDAVIKDFKNNWVLKMFRRNQLLPDLRGVSLHKAAGNVNQFLRVTICMSNFQFRARTH